MTEVKLEHEKPMNILAIVDELKKNGYQLNDDFIFMFYPTRFDSTEGLIPKHTIFLFKDERIATWFSMKYCF